MHTCTLGLMITTCRSVEIHPYYCGCGLHDQTPLCLVTYEMNRTPGGSSLEWMFFPSCMSSIWYFVSRLGSTHVDCKAVWLRRLGSLQHTLQQGKQACCNIRTLQVSGLAETHTLIRETGSLRHALQATGLAAARTSTGETEVGREAWYTWLQLLTMSTMENYCIVCISFHRECNNYIS